MHEYIFNYIDFEHLLCGLILLSRLGDIGSTYLLTPSLKLEANPIAKKLGWKFAIATVLVCLIPYYSTLAGVIVLVPSMLVSASNISRIWFVRSYGENEYLDLLLSLVKKSKLSHALAATIVSNMFIAGIGLLLMLLSPVPAENWGFWFGVGFLLYTFIMAFYGSLFFVTLFRRASENKAVA